MTLRCALLMAGLAMVGCKKTEKSSSKTAPPPPTTGAMNANATTPAAVTPPVSQEAEAKRYDDCWSAWSQAKWDAFAGCYTADAREAAPGSTMPVQTGATAIVDHAKQHRTAFPDAKGQPQLVMVNGNKIIGVTLMTGKNTGPMKTASGDQPATNNESGIYVAQVMTTDPSGKVTHEDDYFDMSTLVHQLKPAKDHQVRTASDKLAMPEQTQLARNDTLERSNLTAVKQLVDAIDHHDAKAVAGLLSDDVKWSERAQPSDLDKKGATDHLAKLWSGFSNLTLANVESTAAGDYVAIDGALQGTNDGDLPAMHVNKTGKKIDVPFAAIYKVSNGKIALAWVFYQSRDLRTQLGIEPTKT
jgi:predicted ester cyclase